MFGVGFKIDNGSGKSLYPKSGLYLRNTWCLFHRFDDVYFKSNQQPTLPAPPTAAIQWSILHPRVLCTCCS
jgi:hypothetical protein